MDHHQAPQVLTDVVQAGTGKTTLVHTLGRACGLEAARVQGTPRPAAG